MSTSNMVGAKIVVATHINEIASHAHFMHGHAVMLFS